MIPKHLPFSGSNNAIVHFRHALSLDEHRVKFIPFFCTGGKHKHNATDTEAFEPDDDTTQDHHHKMGERERSGASFEYENHVNAMTGPDSDVEEVFFTGVHCGALRFFLPQKILYLRLPFKTLVADPCKTVHVTASPAFPFDG